MFEAFLSNRTVSVLAEALPRILTAGLTMTIPLTLVSFFFAMIIAVAVALVQYANVPVLRQAASWMEEQGLMDDVKENEFRPYRYVTKLQTCLVWDKAKEENLIS